ncbi:MAG: thiamine phosphate synthase [Thermomicrobiales bacterium]|nr:thiamine phosphate synthase [Thermomicrobiales bacterium]
MNQLRQALRLYLVANVASCPPGVDLMEIIEQAVSGGVTMVQFRNDLWPEEVVRLILPRVRDTCLQSDTPFIVNDDVELALEVGADGVHLGVHDMPIEEARALAMSSGRQNFLIGYSPETEEDLLTAKQRGANYLGIGPVFPTKTKRDAGQQLGLKEFARRVGLGGLPTVGIGGINHRNFRSVLAAGADGVAVVSAICSSNDPEGVALQLSRN